MNLFAGFAILSGLFSQALWADMDIRDRDIFDKVLRDFDLIQREVTAERGCNCSYMKDSEQTPSMAACIYKKNTKFLLAHMERIQAELKELMAQEEELMGLKKTEGLTYKTWLRDEILDRRALLEKALEFYTKALTVLTDESTTERTGFPLFENADQVRTTIFSTGLAQETDPRVRKLDVWSKVYSKNKNIKMPDINFENLYRIFPKKNKQPTDLVTHDPLQKLEDQDSKEKVQTLYEFIMQKDLQKQFGNSTTTPIGDPEKQGRRLLVKLGDPYSVADRNALLINHPKLIDTATSNYRDVKMLLDTDPIFAKRFSEQMKLARIAVADREGKETGKLLYHPTLADALLFELDVEVMGIRPSSNRVRRYSRNIVRAHEQNKGRLKDLEKKLKKHFRGDCDPSYSEADAAEARKLIEEPPNWENHFYFRSRLAIQGRIQKYSKRGLFESVHYEGPEMVDARVKYVQDEVRWLTQRYPNVQAAYREAAHQTMTASDEALLRSARNDLASRLQSSEKKYFHRSGNVDNSYLFASSASNQGKSSACSAHAFVSDLSAATVKNGQWVPPDPELSAARTYGMIKASELNSDLNAAELDVEVLNKLAKARPKLNLTATDIDKMTREERRTILERELDVGVSYDLQTGMSRVANVFTEKPIPLKQGNDWGALIIENEPFTSKPRTYLKGFAYQSYVSKRPSIEVIKKLLDKGQPPQVFTMRHARRYYEDSMKLEDDFSGIGHVFQVVGYDDKWTDPFDNKVKPAFRVRDSICHSRSCITYYTSAEELMPSVVDISKVTSLERR